MKKSLVGLVSVAVLAMVTTASAIPVSFSVSGFGPVSPGGSADVVRLDPYADTLNLTVGIAATSTINNLYFYVGDSGTLTGDFSFNASRSMTVNLDNQTLTQSGTLLVRLDVDHVVLDPGVTTTFAFGSYLLDVTPLGLTTDSFGVGGSGNYNVQADFLLRQVPDGGMTSMLLGMGMLSLGYFRRLVK
jgi:hypothetical protein